MIKSEDTVYIDLKPYFKRVLKGRKTILAWAVLGAVFGIVMGISKPRTYTSTAVIAPELVTRSTLSSGFNSLASLAGINMNNVAVTDAMHPDLYPVIIKSRDFYLNLFDMPVSFTNADTLVSTTLYDYVAHYNKTPWYSYVFGLPRIAVGAVKSLFVKDEESEAVEGSAAVIDPIILTRQQENVVRALSASVTASVEKKSYVITIRVTMQDRVIAAQVANAVVENLRNFVVKYRTEKALENVAYYQTLRDQTNEEYIKAQRAYAAYLDSNRGEQTSSAQVQRQLLQNEAQLKYQIYNSASQNLLAARAKVQQEAPVLAVIQNGTAPLDGKPSKVRLAIIWFLLGGLAAVAKVALRK